MTNEKNDHKNCICGDCIAKVCMEASMPSDEFVNMGSDLMPIWVLVGKGAMITPDKMRSVMMASEWTGPRPESFDEKWTKQLSDEAIEALKKHDPKSYAEAQAAEKAKYEEEQKITQHLEHPFYKEANTYREDVREEQIVKGARKYPNPFDPEDWTADELLRHAMQENVDQAHYIFGLAEKIKAMQQHCRDLEVINYDLQSELESEKKFAAETQAEIKKKSQAVIENCDLRREIEEMQKRMCQLEADKYHLETELNTTTGKFSVMQTKLNVYQKENDALRRQLERASELLEQKDKEAMAAEKFASGEIERLKTDLEIANDTLFERNNAAEKYKARCEDYEKKLNTLQAYCDGLKAGAEARGKQ